MEGWDVICMMGLRELHGGMAGLMIADDCMHRFESRISSNLLIKGLHVSVSRAKHDFETLAPL